MSKQMQPSQKGLDQFDVSNSGAGEGQSMSGLTVTVGRVSRPQHPQSMGPNTKTPEIKTQFRKSEIQQHSSVNGNSVLSQ